MKNLVCVLDSFVYRLKENQQFKDVRFIHSGRNKNAEKPVASFLVACGVQTEKLVPVKGLSGKLEFVVYAPSGEGKRALTDLCESLVRSLRENDTEGYIEEIDMETADFDSNLTVWCCRLSVRVNLPETVYDNVRAILTICGKDAFNVTSFSVLCNRDYHIARELLSGDSGERFITKESYVLTVTSEGAEDIFSAHPLGGINIYCKETEEEFLNCAVEKSVLKIKASQPVREYNILCKEMRKAV